MIGLGCLRGEKTDTVYEPYEVQEDEPIPLDKVVMKLPSSLREEEEEGWMPHPDIEEDARASFWEKILISFRVHSDRIIIRPQAALRNLKTRVKNSRLMRERAHREEHARRMNEIKSQHPLFIHTVTMEDSGFGPDLFGMETTINDGYSSQGDDKDYIDL